MKSRYFFPNVIVKKIIFGKKYLLFFKRNLIIFPFKHSLIVKEMTHRYFATKLQQQLRAKVANAID